MKENEMYKENDIKVKSRLSLGEKLAIVLLVIIILALLYLIFMKEDNSSKVENGKAKVEENTSVVDKLSFTKMAISETGEMYLDSKGMVYFHLSDEARNANPSIINLEKEYSTVSNNIYNQEKIKAILINIVDVKDIEYITSDQNSYNNNSVVLNFFRFTTNNNRKYQFIDGGLLVEDNIYKFNTISLTEVIDSIDPNLIIH